MNDDRPGLRERKKAGTRTAIQRHAVRLFREQGYDATSIEQIARAADVSHRTVFRYFPSKESLVTTDDTGSRLAEACRAQPDDLEPVAALRAALRSVLADVDVEATHDRQALVLGVPALWAASLPSITATNRVLIELVAERSGRPTTEPRVRALAGAVFGVLLSVWLDWAADPSLDAPATLDAALAELERRPSAS